MRTKPVLVVGVTFLLSTALTAYASCGTDYWQANVNTAWEYGLNWSLGFAPTACDAVVLPDPVHGEQSGAIANQNQVQGKLYPMDSLQIGNNSAAGSLTIDTGAQFQIANDLVVGVVGSLTNNASVQVRGTGYVGVRAPITTSASFLFQNDLYTAGQISVDGGTFTVNHDLYNNGSISVGGATLSVNGVIHNTGVLHTGVAGMIATPQLENGGMLQIGPGGPGTVSVGTGTSQNTGYVQYANGILDEVITSPNSFGQIFTNSAILDGTLNIELANGFNPLVGTTYQIIWDGGGTATGTFTTITNRYFNNGREMWDVLYGSTNSTHYVDLEALGVPMATPEPSSLSLLATGVIGLFARRSRISVRPRCTWPSRSLEPKFMRSRVITG